MSQPQPSGPQPGAGTGGPTAAAPTPTPPPASANVEELTAQQAQTRYGFVLYQPGYVPNGYSLLQQQINAHQPGGTVAAATVYDGPPAHQPTTPTYLSIQQSVISAGQPRPFAVGDAEVVDVTVRGRQRTWITQAKVGIAGDGHGAWQAENVDHTGEGRHCRRWTRRQCGIADQLPDVGGRRLLLYARQQFAFPRGHAESCRVAHTIAHSSRE